MISELLREAVGIIGNRESLKHSINGVLRSSSSSSSPSISPALSPSPSPSASTVTTPTSSSTSSASEKLRCPRCDSTNTKFCYYNNYNLTQPRHFCKTCRRYWTKGGALRNVPIGGGCRKNKSTAIASSSHVIKSTAAGKIRAMAAEMGKSGFMSNFEQEFSSSASNANPILWASPDQNSHMLSLLRANQKSNPISGPMSSSTVVKEEVSIAGSHGNSSQAPVVASGALMNAQILGLNASAGRVLTSFGVSTTASSLRRENECQNIGFILGEAQGTGGVHEFYQRRRSPETNYCPGAGNEAVVVGNINNVCSSSSSSCLTILQSAPVVAAADELGCWNPILSWSDFPTTHGAYP